MALSEGVSAKILKRICKLGHTRYLTEYYVPRRPDQRTMGAASTTASTPKTEDGTAGSRPSPPSQWHVVDSPHWHSLARSARALWPLAYGRPPLLPLAESWRLPAPV